MKFDSLSDMLDHFHSVSAMRDHVESEIDRAQSVMTDGEHITHVFIDRDLLICGFQLREIDAFLEGLLYDGGNNEEIYK